MTEITKKEFVFAAWHNAYQLEALDDKLKTQKTFDEHFEVLKHMGIDIVFFLVKDHKGLFYYNTDHGKTAADWDILDYVVKKSKEYKISIQPYINVFGEGEDFLAEYPEYAERQSDGNTINWASPGAKKVRERILKIITEIVKKYDIDGIQLDRIRYDDSNNVGFHPESVKLYREKYMKEPEIGDTDFVQFRCDLVSSFVKEVYEKVKSIKPEIKFSAAVWPTPTIAKARVHQQWDKWVENKYVDIICPMSYTADIGKFREYTIENINTVKRKVNCTSFHSMTGERDVKLYVGIGAYYEGVTHEILKEQIEFAKNSGADGVVFFNAYYIFEQQYYQLIKEMKRRYEQTK